MTYPRGTNAREERLGAAKKEIARARSTALPCGGGGSGGGIEMKEKKEKQPSPEGVSELYEN